MFWVNKHSPIWSGTLSKNLMAGTPKWIFCRYLLILTLVFHESWVNQTWTDQTLNTGAYQAGRARPVFLRVGQQTVRVPNFRGRPGETGHFWKVRIHHAK